MAKKFRACITPISYGRGQAVTTIEGLPAVWAAEKELERGRCSQDAAYPIQQAWIDEQVSAVRLLPERG